MEFFETLYRQFTAPQLGLSEPSGAEADAFNTDEPQTQPPEPPFFQAGHTTMDSGHMRDTDRTVEYYGIRTGRRQVFTLAYSGPASRIDLQNTAMPCTKITWISQKTESHSGQS